MQKIYNVIIDVVKFLVVGLMEIMERIGHLVSAARQMPDHFWGEAQREVIGMNLNEPLPFERTKEPTANDVVETSREAGVVADADVTLLKQGTFSDQDVAVDQVAELDSPSELFSALDLEEGQELEFGESGDRERSLASIKAEAMGVAPATEGEPPGEMGGGELAATTTPKTAEEELQELMNQQVEGGCTKEKKGEPSKGGDIPEAMKKGPFTPSQRGRYMWHQIKQGISQWFDCNWPWLLAAAVGALLGFILLNILTGGAVLAALPLIMQIVGAIMIGVAIVRVTAKVGEYLSEGWAGNITTSAVALAAGLAIGAIELIFALLFNAGAVIKALKGGLKGAVKAAATAAKTTIKTTVKNIRQLGKLGLQAGKAMVRNGKLVLRGVQKGVVQGAKSLDDLARRLWSKVRFRKFKIRIKNRRFQLFGYINPWVLLADGSVENVSFKGEGRKVVGESVTVGGRKGIVVGIKDTKPSQAVQELLEKVGDATKIVENKALFKKIKNLSPDDIKRIITNRETTYQLRKGIPGPKPPHFQAHHVVPRELRGNRKIKGFLDDIGFGFEDGARNGVMLPAKSNHGIAAWKNATLHRGSHPGYTKKVERFLTTLADDYRRAVRPGMSSAELGNLHKLYNAKLDRYLAAVKDGLKQGAVKL